MPKRSLPAYCLHRGSGQAYVKIDGKREYLGKHNSPESHRRYAALVEKWQRTAEAEPGRLPSRVCGFFWLPDVDGGPLLSLSALDRGGAFGRRLGFSGNPFSEASSSDPVKTNFHGVIEK